MDARLPRMACAAISVVAMCFSLGASYRTQNFIVSAASPQLAKEIGDTSETLRRNLAMEWLGRELPPWRDPCPITATVGPTIGAGGVTSFAFERGQPFHWTMSVQGSHERVLDSVLPHEITHTIFATHFGGPLPRWADEGACTTVEHSSERNKHEKFLNQFLRTDRGIAFNKMFAMKEYPADILPLYSQGYSLARYLIQQGGKKKFVTYVGEGMRANNWSLATRNHYGYTSLSDLQVKWLDWVRQGAPDQMSMPDQAIAAANAPGEMVPVAPIRPASSSLASVENPQPQVDSMVPAETALAQAPSNSRSPADGWYARQRDQALQQKSRTSNPRSVPARTVSLDTSVTRPQEPQRPEQTILEWSKDPRTATGPVPMSPRNPANRPNAYPPITVEPRGTFYR